MTVRRLTRPRTRSELCYGDNIMKLEILAGHILAFCSTAVFHVIIAFGIVAYGLYLLGVNSSIAISMGCITFCISELFAHYKIHRWIRDDFKLTRRPVAH